MSVNQQYNTFKNNYPFPPVTLQSASNKSLHQSTVQPTIIKQFQNSNIDHTLSSKSTIPKTVPEKPKLQLSIVSNMTTVDSLNASTQTKEKKQVTKQPRKLENNSMPLMGMFTNPNGIPHGELIISLLLLFFFIWIEILTNSILKIWLYNRKTLLLKIT